MRSVGIPEVESEDTGAPIPESVTPSGTPQFVPIVSIVAVGALLVYLLSALGDLSSSNEPVAPPTTLTPPTTLDAEVVDAADVDVEPQLAPVSLRGLASGIQIGVDQLEESPITPTIDGFSRVAPIDGRRAVLFSPTGTDWNTAEASRAPQFENGRVSGMDVSPDYEVEVVVFRSVDGVVVSIGDGQVEKIPILHEAELVELVVGNNTAYLTLRDPTNDPLQPRFVVLRVTYGDDFSVRGINPRNELGDGFERLRNGTVLSDGRIVAIATDRTNTVAKLVEFRSDDVIDLELDETNTDLLTEAQALLAHGNNLVLVDGNDAVFAKSPDSSTFIESTLPVDPNFSTSRDGTLLSVSLEAVATIIRLWRPGSNDALEVTFNARIEPLEVVSMNSTEALLRTAPASGQRWLINVPFPAE